jgi:hypothetical protein
VAEKENAMFRRSLLILVASLAVVSVQAGGWAVTTLESLPDAIEVGKPVTLSFMVRQHGVTPAAGLDAWVEAVAGKQRVRANAVAGSQAGRYSATLVLPQAGEWTISVNGWGKLELAPIVAWEGRAPAPLSEAERGRRLFTAKGCVTCHNGNMAPAIVPYKYHSEFLARVLADPAGTLPPSRTFGSMPNLELRQPEIASLVAFINGGTFTATRTGS